MAWVVDSGGEGITLATSTATCPSPSASTATPGAVRSPLRASWCRRQCDGVIIKVFLEFTPKLCVKPCPLDTVLSPRKGSMALVNDDIIGKSDWERRAHRDGAIGRDADRVRRQVDAATVKEWVRERTSSVTSNDDTRCRKTWSHDDFAGVSFSCCSCQSCSFVIAIGVPSAVSKVLGADIESPFSSKVDQR